MTAPTEHAELTNVLEGVATGLAQPYDTTHYARICDCTDDTHPYAPTTSDWAWMPAADIDKVRVFHGGVHVRHMTVVAVRVGDAL